MSKKLLNLIIVTSLVLALMPVLVFAQEAEGQDYTVQKDDWLSKLSEKYLGNVMAYAAIVDATNKMAETDSKYHKIDNPDLIEPGWVIFIPKAVEGKGYKVLLSMKGPGGGNPFWAAVEKGAVETAAAMGVDLTVLAPPAETDVETQIAQVEDQITKGVQAILIAPTDVDALSPTLDKAKAAGIPVLYVDTKGNWADALTFIGTSNYAAGKMGGEFLCSKLTAGDEVALITGVMSQQTHIDRVGGAKEAIEACGLKVVAEQPANSEKALGQTVMENILTANPNVKGVFASNDNMALGAMEAIKQAGKTGKDILVVGFDGNDEAVASVNAGEMAATVAQQPYNMGKFGVENAVKVLDGGTIDQDFIDTGAKVISMEAEAAPAAAGYKVFLSMKGPGGGNPFWAAVEKGAVETAAAMGVDLTVLAPPAETDVETQIAQIEDQLTKGAQAMVIAATDVEALNPTLDKVKAAGVPVMFVDSAANWDGALTFIGTSNYAAGKQGGEFLCKYLSAGDEVAIITGVMTAQTMIDRVGGAREAMQACGLNVVSEQPANSEKALGQTVMENILTSNPNVKGVFAANDNMALGAMEAVKLAGKTGNDVLIVGFDANPDALASVEAGEMAASVAQSPYNMGKFGVENAVKAIKGEAITESFIDTGSEVMSREISMGGGEAAAPAAGEIPAGKGKLVIINNTGYDLNMDIIKDNVTVVSDQIPANGGKKEFMLDPGTYVYNGSAAGMGGTVTGDPITIEAGKTLEFSIN